MQLRSFSQTRISYFDKQIKFKYSYRVLKKKPTQINVFLKVQLFTIVNFPIGHASKVFLNYSDFFGWHFNFYLFIFLQSTKYDSTLLYLSVDINQGGHVGDSISNSMCTKYLPWLLICPSAKSLIYKGQKAFSEHGIIWFLWLGLFTDKTILHFCAPFPSCTRIIFQSFQFLVPELERYT